MQDTPNVSSPVRTGFRGRTHHVTTVMYSFPMSSRFRNCHRTAGEAHGLAAHASVRSEHFRAPPTRPQPSRICARVLCLRYTTWRFDSRALRSTESVRCARGSVRFMRTDCSVSKPG